MALLLQVLVIIKAKLNVSRGGRGGGTLKRVLMQPRLPSQSQLQAAHTSRCRQERDAETMAGEGVVVAPLNMR